MLDGLTLEPPSPPHTTRIPDRRKYALQGRESITVVAKNFNRHTGGKIPDDICRKVNQYLKEHDPAPDPVGPRELRRSTRRK